MSGMEIWTLLSLMYFLAEPPDSAILASHDRIAAIRRKNHKAGQGSGRGLF